MRMTIRRIPDFLRQRKNPIPAEYHRAFQIETARINVMHLNWLTMLLLAYNAFTVILHITGTAYYFDRGIGGQTQLTLALVQLVLLGTHGPLLWLIRVRHLYDRPWVMYVAIEYLVLNGLWGVMHLLSVPEAAVGDMIPFIIMLICGAVFPVLNLKRHLLIYGALQLCFVVVVSMLPMYTSTRISMLAVSLLLGCICTATSYWMYGAQLSNYLNLKYRQELSEAYEELERLNQTDTLTGIANRRHFNEVLGSAWSHCARQRMVLSLMMVDVDYFKLYNDTYGHPKGDEALVKVARCLRQSVERVTDLAARVGGEEFMLVLPFTDQQGAELVGRRIQQLLQELAIEHKASPFGQYLTVSIGLVTAVPYVGVASIQQLEQEVDQAMYEAKHAGRNQIIVKTLFE